MLKMEEKKGEITQTMKEKWLKIVQMKMICDFDTTRQITPKDMFIIW